MERKNIYLDNNATTMVAPEVIEAMLPFLKERWGNPSSIHRFGGTVRRDVEKARAQVAELLGASPEEIYFTSCGTESDNLALKGFFAIHQEKTRIITSNVEHPAILNTARYLHKLGAHLIELEVGPDGLLDPEIFKNLPIDEHTIVSIMWANNETGVIFPIEEIAPLVKAKGGIIHTDAVQAAGKLKIDVKKANIDMLSISGHKLHAPKGIGAIYIRKGLKIEPLLHGGHQEKGMRAGTENVAFCVGLGVACELANKSFDKEEQIKKLRDWLEDELLNKCAGAKLNGHKEKRVCNTTNISFEDIEGEAILLHLDEYGIAASSGSACTSGSLEPSHVMRAMGVPYNYAHSSIRFSLSRYTTKEEIEKVIEVMPKIVDKLRALSPFVSVKKTTDIREEIKRLKKEKNAIILAHNYQPPEIQDCADYVGDSYGLSVEATRTNADIIVFCGVRFMAETAAILNPKRKVILVEPLAGCPMAEMISEEELQKLKEKYPNYIVMCYVNSTAEIKALSDVCCTSSNAVKIAKKIPEDKGIIFIPDKHLGSWIMEQTGRKNMILWEGFCPTHMRITPEKILKVKKEHPQAEVLIHPEATSECRKLADAVLSTGGMCEYVAKSNKKEFIIGTEVGLLYTLKKNNPHKEFFPVASNILCPNMKRTRLESVRDSLLGNGGEEIKLQENVVRLAQLSLKKMLELSS